MESGQDRMPTFIGIGASKSGSSWLYTILVSHQEVYAPVKEVNYFTSHVEKGIDWYKNIFAGNSGHKHIGEMTPTYLYHEKVATLISEQAPLAKILVILRNPANRAYSQFKTDYYIGKSKSKTFDEYLKENPLIIQRGFYAKHLGNYLKRIPKTNIKVFIFEEAISNTDQLKNELAEFLDIDPFGFTDEALTKKINASDPPKFRKLYQVGVAVARFMQLNSMYKTSKFIKRTGSKLFKLLGTGKDEAPAMSKGSYSELMAIYSDDIAELSALLERPEPIWE